MPKYRTNIRRSVAIEKLDTLIERADIWNENYASKYWIYALVLYGSLARNADEVGQVEIVCQVLRTTNGTVLHDLDDYLQWRKQVLGYAIPQQHHLKLRTVSEDPLRFIKNRDGRLVIQPWKHVPTSSLASEPFVTVYMGGVSVYDSIEDAIFAAKPIRTEEWLDLIETH